MPKEVYEIVALAARYLFILLGVIIVLRAFHWLRKDRAEKHRRLKALPDAGMIGEFVVLRGSRELPEGTSIPVPYEGVLGFVRSCDMVVPCPEVRKHHLDVRFEDGIGLLVMPRSGCSVLIDGISLDCRSHFADHPMLHGSVLEVGSALLRLRLFSGVNAGRFAAFMPDRMPEMYPAAPAVNSMPYQVRDEAAEGSVANTVQHQDPLNGRPAVSDDPAQAFSQDKQAPPRKRRAERWKEG